MTSSPRVALLRRSLLSLACAALAACSGGGKPAESPKAKAERLDAVTIARSIGDGKVELSLYVDRLRSHPAAPRIAALEPIAATFEGTGVDVLRDFERVYANGPSVRDEQKIVVVAKHGLSREQIDRAMTALLASSSPPGKKLDQPFPAVVVTRRNQTRVVAEPEPGYLVVLPPDKQDAASRFTGTSGFKPAPDKLGAELLADDPHTTLHAPGAPRAPEGLRKLQARVLPRDDGGADVRIEGQSNSADQAPADAEAMTREIARATSAKVAFVTVHFFREVPFRVEGDKVRGEVNLSPDEVDQIVSLSSRYLH